MMLGSAYFSRPASRRECGRRQKKEKGREARKSIRMITFGRIVTITVEQFAFGPDHFDFSGWQRKSR